LDGDQLICKCEVGEQRVASFSLAVNRKTSAGKQQTLWVRVNAWNGLAEVAVKYIRKSSLIQCEATSTWMPTASSCWIPSVNFVIVSPRTSRKQETEQIPF
jgi:hypothetical protein